MGFSRNSAAVAISTRNRGADVRRTIESVLASDHPDFGVVVVDQSDDDGTFDAVREFLDRTDFRYIRSAYRGVAAGRNEAIASVQSEFVAITDDDCEVAPDWLREIEAALQHRDSIGLVFGTVAAAPHDASRGFIPAYYPATPFLATSIRHKHRVEGLGASMGIRRSVWRTLQGFDENFGAGGRFHAGEELDFAVRTLLSGYAVYETPAARVTHHGFRTWSLGRTLIWGYLYGGGAMFGMRLKARQWPVASLAYRLAWRWAFEQPMVCLSHKPSRLLCLHAFACGFVAALRTPARR